MRKLHIIKGDWMVDGYLARRKPLDIYIHSSPIKDAFTGEISALQSASDGGLLYCEQWGNDCPIITNGCWTFAPDAGELERLKIIPQQMIIR